VYVDERRNKQAHARITEQGGDAYVYAQVPSATGLAVRLASRELINLWKRSAILKPDAIEPFETVHQFAPVMLVVDATNEGTGPQQIVNAYLEVASSNSDLQPLILMTGGAGCGGGGMVKSFDFSNYGWGAAENAVLSFTFTREQRRTQTFEMQLGNLGSVEAIPSRAVAALAPEVGQWRSRPPKCASMARVPTCLSQLEQQGKLGRLAGLTTTSGNSVGTHVVAELTYRWHDVSGRVTQRSSPVQAVFELFQFDTGEGPECGAGGPGEAGFKSIRLELDRTNYRIPLPFRGAMGPRQNRRFELTLTAIKASQHNFQVVLELADGSRSASVPVELLYFTPQLKGGALRSVR
jgi:hypothetical protein